MSARPIRFFRSRRWQLTHARAFTIIESLLMLAILAVLSMLILALIRHQMKPQLPLHLRPGGTESGGTPAPETGFATRPAVIEFV